VLSTIAAAPMGAAIRGILPFLIILLIVLAIITYVPDLTFGFLARCSVADKTD